MTTSTVSVTITHITMTATRPYYEVKTRIEAEVQRLDETHRELLAQGNTEELRAKLEVASKPHGLMIHYVGVHGDWLALTGQRRPGIVYHIGNVLEAVKMTQQKFGASLYAPLRVAVYENSEGGTTFEYDLPSTQFIQFHTLEIDMVAKELDQRMSNLIESVTR